MRIIGLLIGSILGLLVVVVPAALAIMVVAVSFKLFLLLYGLKTLIITFVIVAFVVVMAALIGAALDS